MVSREHDRPTAEELTLADLIGRYVHVARGPLIVDALNPRKKFRLHEFHALYAHCSHGDGKRAMPTTRAWATHRLRVCVDDLGFDPGHGRFYQNEGCTYFNQWTPPNWPTADVRQAAPFFEHCEFLVPDSGERSDLLDWLAATVQQPEVRPHWHALLVTPTQGMGRSWLGEVLRRLFTEHHVAELDLHSLLEDSFNSELSAKLVVVVHEVKAPPNERFQHKERLNSLLTDTRLVVNEKHLPRWSEKFVARFLMFTNRSDALPLSESDRRLYVVRCGNTPRDTAYYGKLYRLLDDRQFLAAVWHALRVRDLTNYNPGMIAPLTEAKLAMIDAGRTAEQQRAVDFLRAAPFDVITARDLAAVLTPLGEHESAKEHQQRHAAVLAVFRELGVQTYPKKLWIAGESPTRVWILRSPDKWRVASMETVREAVVATTKALSSHGLDANRLLRSWAGESIAASEF